MKLKYVFMALFISALAACKPVKKETTSMGDLSCYENSERPSQAITYKEMASMFEQYDSKQGALLHKHLGEEETTSNFYRIEDLKQYIAYVERLSKEKEIPLTGIRIFAAAYPEDYEKEAYQEKQTLVFAPTTTIKGKEGVAYEPLYSEKGNPIPMRKFLNEFSGENSKKVNRAGMFPSFSTTRYQKDLLSSGANRTHISPPH